jgi:membrane associated rhomboid family serine protease
MSLPPRVAAAVEILDAKGIKRRNSTPPLHRLFWRLGIEAAPPHFTGFWRLAAGFGTYFGVMWGLLMWVLFWRGEDLSVSGIMIRAALGGAIFGLAMALYSLRARRKYALPPWSEIRSERLT